jgi:hypothetical protein
MSSSSSTSGDSKPVYHVLIWTAVLILALVQVFLSFRGFTSADGMDQAQIAREMARGNGFTSRLLRPMALQQAQAAGKEITFLRLPDTAQPPVQPMLLAPIFKAMQSKWPFGDKRRIYTLDRVVACLGVTWLLITLTLVHGITKRLFDLNLAAFTVLALALSLPLWQMAIEGSSRMLLVMLTTLFLHRLVEMLQRDAAGEPAGAAQPFFLTILGGVMTLTHWMGVWLVLSLAVGWWLVLPSARRGVWAMLLVMLLCLAGWSYRLHLVGGDPMGIVKAWLISPLTTDHAFIHMRDLDGQLPSVYIGTLFRRLNNNVRDMLGNIYALLLGCVPALLAGMSLLHRFRNPVVMSLRTVLFVAWLGVIFGSVVMGNQGSGGSDMQVHATLVPLLSAFGLAIMAVLWSRLQEGKRTLWSDFGYAFVVITISAWPMASGLYTGVLEGLFAKDKLVSWPPYMADATSMLNKLTDEPEIIVTDQPWSVAWYADRTALWFPKNRAQFDFIQKDSTAKGHPVVGMFISPSSTLNDAPHTLHTGPYENWAPIMLRAPVLGLGIDLGDILKDQLLFRKPLPLGGMPLPDGRLVPFLTFYSNDDRSQRLKP